MITGTLYDFTLVFMNIYIVGVQFSGEASFSLLAE